MNERWISIVVLEPLISSLGVAHIKDEMDFVIHRLGAFHRQCILEE